VIGGRGKSVEIRQDRRIAGANHTSVAAKRDARYTSQAVRAPKRGQQLREGLLGLAAHDDIDKWERLQGLDSHSRCLRAAEHDRGIRVGALDPRAPAALSGIAAGDGAEPIDVGMNALQRADRQGKEASLAPGLSLQIHS